MLSMSERINIGTQNSKEKQIFSRVLLDVNNLGAELGNRTIFKDVTFMVREGESVALVGDNDYAKNTLLKALAGLSIHDSGEITNGKNVSIEYVPREFLDMDSSSNISVKDFFYRSRDLDQLEINKAKLEEQLESDFSDEKIKEYSVLLEKYERKGAYTADAEIAQILNGFSLKEVSLETKISEVSSGQRNKLILGRAIFSKKELLILDDPITYLDSDSKKWLSDFFKKSNQGCIITSNDYEFLNLFCNRVVELLPSGRVVTFQGNYNDFLKSKDVLTQTEKNETDNLSKKINQLEGTLKEQKVWGDINTAASVNVRRTARRIDRLNQDKSALPSSLDQKINNTKSLFFEFESRSGKDVVVISNVKKRYNNEVNIDLSNLDLTVNYGDRLVVLGINGSGKSTLLRLLAMNEKFHQTSGEIRLGQSVKLGYYASDYQNLLPENTIIQEVKRDAYFIKKIRSALTFWGFDQKIIEKTKVKTLSSGEKAQLSLAKLLVSNINLLILDEPTMGLSPLFRKRLIDAINGYKGTLIVSSHDPDFLEELKPNKKLTLPEGKLEVISNKIE